MNNIVIIAIILFVIFLFIAVIRVRRANPKQSATDMHPSNFEKSRIERVEKNINQQK
jgi:hypothetical protein